MARKIDNEKNFLIIGITPVEGMEELNFGFGNELVCDDCNDLITTDEEIYYIAALNMVYCKQCYEDWIAKATHYPDDADYEKNNYNWHAANLDLELI